MRRLPSQPTAARAHVAAVIQLSLAIACAPPAASSPVHDAPISAPSPASAAVPDDGGARDLALERDVTLIAKPGLWPLEVEAAEALLSSIAPVQREQPQPDRLMLSGGPAGPLRRFNVSYSRDEDGRWTFTDADFVFEDSDMVQLHQTLESVLFQRLGSPTWSQRSGDGEFPTDAWSFGSAMRLSFAPNDEREALTIAISGPEG